MMTWYIVILLKLNMLIMINANNPMKVSLFVLLGAAGMFLLIKVKTGSVWLPLIFFLLFMGGILLMFMILSSVLPNEKSYKMKFYKTILTITSVMAVVWIKNMNQNNLSPQMKSFFSSTLTMVLMMLMILIYFLNSVNLNTTEESPMRSLQC